MVCEALGRMMVAQVLAYGFQQAERPESQRIPVSLIIDECQNFLSADIDLALTELRKYGLHLTLAQQFVGQDMSTKIKQTVLSNCAVKIFGG